MDEAALLVAHQRLGHGEAGRAVGRDQQLRAVRARQCRTRRVGRGLDHDLCAHAGFARREGGGHRVVAGAHGRDAERLLRGREAPHRVQRAARLEGAGALEQLQLHDDIGAAQQPLDGGAVQRRDGRAQQRIGVGAGGLADGVEVRDREAGCSWHQSLACSWHQSPVAGGNGFDLDQRARHHEVGAHGGTRRGRRPRGGEDRGVAVVEFGEVADMAEPHRRLDDVREAEPSARRMSSMRARQSRVCSPTVSPAMRARSSKAIWPLTNTQSPSRRAGEK
jgi:hypothetical protein